MRASAWPATFRMMMLSGHAVRAKGWDGMEDRSFFAHSLVSRSVG